MFLNLNLNLTLNRLCSGEVYTHAHTHAHTHARTHKHLRMILNLNLNLNLILNRVCSGEGTASCRRTRARAPRGSGLFFFLVSFFPFFWIESEGSARLRSFFISCFFCFLFLEQEQGLREAQVSFTVYTYIHPIIHTHTHTHIHILRRSSGLSHVVVGHTYT